MYDSKLGCIPVGVETVLWAGYLMNRTSILGTVKRFFSFVQVHTGFETRTATYPMYTAGSVREGNIAEM
jgi:hypothetical protein